MNQQTIIARSVYDFAHRVQYEEFVTAARTTTTTLVRQHSGNASLKIDVDCQGGKTACVGREGNVVRVSLPSYARDRIITGGQARRLLGFLVHEILHILHTDLNNFAARLKNAAQRFQVPVMELATLNNALEDYFIERTGTAPDTNAMGAASELLGSLNASLFTTETAARAGAGHAADQARSYILHHINRHGRQVAPGLDEAQALCASLAPADVATLCAAALDTLDAASDRAAATRNPNTNRAQWSAERLEISAALLAALAMIEQQKQDEQQQQQNDQPQDGQPQPGEGQATDAQPDQQQDADAAGAGQGQPDAQPGQQDADADAGGQPSQTPGTGQGDIEAPANPETASDNQDSDQQGADRAKGGEAAGGTSPQEPAAATTNAEQQRAELATADMPEPTQDERNDAQQYSTSPTTAAHSFSIFEQPLARETGTATMIDRAARTLSVRRLADSMRRGLKSVENFRRTNNEVRGRIDSRAFARGLAGSKAIYTQRHHDAGMSSSVQIMIDGSASMAKHTVVAGEQTNRWGVALALASAMAPALKRAGARYGIAVFHGKTCGQDKNDKHRHVGTVRTLCRLGDPERVGRKALEAVRHMDNNGGTPMLQELNWCRGELIKENTDRRIALWLIDGRPQGDKATFRREFERQRREGLEVYGIGIHTGGAIADLFSPGQFVEVAGDLGKLPEAVRVMLENGAR